MWNFHNKLEFKVKIFVYTRFGLCVRLFKIMQGKLYFYFDDEFEFLNLF